MLVVVIVAMYAIAGAKGATPIDDVELRARLVSRHPEAAALIGGLGLLALVWLRVMKPGM